ncbi:hypothetical protein C8Q80DRAFT_320656 [Daedaleopsis nitida]|nr:hypothetical protein C8Q80DRAFT_320656 [Daedaleopsis nitida]
MSDASTSTALIKLKSQTRPRLQQRLTTTAYALLSAYFENITRTPTAEQYNDLFAQVRQLPGCDECKPGQVRKYFERKRNNTGKFREVVPKVEGEDPQLQPVEPVREQTGGSDARAGGLPMEGESKTKPRKSDRLCKDAYKILDGASSCTESPPSSLEEIAGLLKWLYARPRPRLLPHRHPVPHH